MLPLYTNSQFNKMKLLKLSTKMGTASKRLLFRLSYTVLPPANEISRSLNLFRNPLLSIPFENSIKVFFVFKQTFFEFSRFNGFLHTRSPPTIPFSTWGPKSYNAQRNSIFSCQNLNAYSTTPPLAPKILTTDL